MTILSLKLACIGMFCAGLASPSQALDRRTILTIQGELTLHGFDTGGYDGLVGPATREAMAGFSRKFGSPPDIDGILKFMMEKSYEARVPVVDEGFLEELENAVGKNLRDPSSVQLRDVYKIPRGNDFDDGTKNPTYLVCGEVNGKNAYGGYAGFTSFSIGLTFETLAQPTIDAPDSNFAKLSCLVTFPIDRSGIGS